MLLVKFSSNKLLCLGSRFNGETMLMALSSEKITFPQKE